MNSADDLETIAAEILAYLRQHPAAADTFDGVLHWWLIRQRYLRGLRQVQSALNLLIDQGLVVETLSADNSRVYSSASNPNVAMELTCPTEPSAPRRKP